MMENLFGAFDNLASLPPDPVPNRITGVGRMRVRGRDKSPVRDHRKWKNARKQSRQSRRRNRK